MLVTNVIIQGICSSFLLECLQGVHAPADEYRIALYTHDATLLLETTVYTAAKEVVGQGYAAGGQALTGYLSLLESGVALLDWDDPVWQLASITARAALIYNFSKGNRAVAVLDLGQDFTSTNGSFTVTLPEPTPTTALIRIGN